MKSGVKYRVFASQRDISVGYFLDKKFYEWSNKDRPVGHLDQDNNFYSYVVNTSGESPKISGKYADGILKRNDGTELFVQPDEE